MELTHRVAVVTGAAKGIGYAMAEAFLAGGARHVIVLDLVPEQVNQAASDLGERASGFTVDVSDADQLTTTVRTIEDTLGPIDLFVSNAGIGTGAGLEADDATWERIWQVNVLAHVYAARAVLPAMLARGEGYLVSTASAAGLLTQIGDLPYSVTKHAAVSVAEWLAVTYGDRGITVSCLCPQYVNTDMLAQAAGDTPVAALAAMGLIEPGEVATAVVAAIAEERFLILPHPEIAEYYRRRATDTDRWLAGMRRLQDRIMAVTGDVPGGPVG
jgi:NAD(P)-dependent dehydrogenase (short-subunit alcohol dehydrogenase family)